MALQNTDKNADVENYIIGSILEDNSLYHIYGQNINSDMFYHLDNGKIFQAISDLSHENRYIDQLTLSEKGIDKNGNISEILKLRSKPDEVKIDTYSEIIINHHMKYKIGELSEIMLKKTSSSDKASVLIEDILFKTNEIARMDNRITEFVSAQEAFKKIFEDEKGRKIKTGIPDIDENTPIRTSGITVLAGRTSMGKSALGVSMCRGMAMNGHKTHVYSLEMSDSDMVARMTTETAYINDNVKVEYEHLVDEDKRKELTQLQQEAVTNAGKNLPDFDNLKIIDKARITVSEIMSRTLAAKEKPDVIYIDYLDEIDDRDFRRGTNLRTDQILGEIVRSLRVFGKEHDIAVILVVQLNRSGGKRSESLFFRPTLEDLKNSGEIEQIADMVLLVYRKYYYILRLYGDDLEAVTDDEHMSEIMRTQNKMEIICAKRRMGRTGSRLVACDLKINYFDKSMEKYEEVF